MKKHNLTPEATDELKKRAELFLKKKPSFVKKLPRRDTQELIEDLHVHQIEMEMKNEELRRAHEELEKAKGIYADLYKFAPVGYLTLDQNNLIFRINLAAAKLLGIERRRLLGSRFSRFISPDSVDFFYQHVRQCLDTRKKQTCELKLKNDAENARYIQLESMAVSDEEGDFNRIRMAMIDITTRKEADDRIRALSQELLRAQENERQMISRELHDRIGQDLSMVKMGYDALMEDLPVFPAEAREKASELSNILHGVINAVRDLSYDLRPPYLEKADIVHALYSFCKEFSRNTGIKVDFFSAGMERIELDYFIRINIYRLVQEGLNNVLKHAEASQVDVTFSYTKPELLLRIIDNGKGFNVQKRLATLTSEKRMGIRSMKERVMLLGGTMTVQSKVRHGTKIFVRLSFRGKNDG